MAKPVTWWMTSEEIFKAFIVRAFSMFFSCFPCSSPSASPSCLPSSAAVLSTSF